MARSINRVTLVGRVGRDPEVDQESGEKVARLSVATFHGVPERIEWHRVEFRGELAITTELYIRKGDHLYVEGRIEYGSYERNGVTIPVTTIVVHDLILLRAVGR